MGEVTSCCCRSTSLTSKSTSPITSGASPTRQLQESFFWTTTPLSRPSAAQPAQEPVSQSKGSCTITPVSSIPATTPLVTSEAQAPKPALTPTSTEASRHSTHVHFKHDMLDPSGHTAIVASATTVSALREPDFMAQDTNFGILFSAVDCPISVNAAGAKNNPGIFTYDRP